MTWLALIALVPLLGAFLLLYPQTNRWRRMSRVCAPPVGVAPMNGDLIATLDIRIHRRYV